MTDSHLSLNYLSGYSQRSTNYNNFLSGVGKGMASAIKKVTEAWEWINCICMVYQWHARVSIVSALRWCMAPSSHLSELTR